MKYKLNSDEMKGEIERSRSNNDKKKDQIDQLVKDNRMLEDGLSCVSSECKILEADISTLSKKHEYSVNDFSNAIKRLEQENYNLLKVKEDLERIQQEKNNEQRNINFDLKYQKEEAIKRESALNDSQNKIESDAMHAKETYRNLLNDNTDLTRKYEECVKEKERQSRDIMDLKDKELAIESKIRSVHEEYVNRDFTDIRNNAREHNTKRQE